MNHHAFAYPRIMARLVNRPLLLHPVTALVVYNALAARLGTSAVEIPATPDGLRFDASRFAGEDVLSEDDGGKHVEPYRVSNGVGILTVTGELVNRGAYTGSYSGLTSYEGIGYQLNRLAKDKRVSRVLLDIESPGGEAVGAFETADAVRALNEVKPVTAVVNGMAASAAYALASGAKRIVTTPSGISGSIGVVMLHLDFSRALEAEGVTPTLIFAGAHKTEGNPFEPLSDDVKAGLQGEVKTVYDLFLKTVAAGRGYRMTAKAARETEARTYIGADAVNVNLADEVGTFDEVLSDLQRKAARPGPTTTKRQAMAKAIQHEDDEIEVLTVSEAQALAGGAASDAAINTQAECYARMQAILADPRSQGRERFCINLACKAPNMSAEDLLAVAADVPIIEQRAEPVMPRVAERASAEAAQISSAPVAEPKAEPGTTWKGAVAKVNERTGAIKRKSIQH